jgi:hypothetical protein
MVICDLHFKKQDLNFENYQISAAWSRKKINNNEIKMMNEMQGG